MVREILRLAMFLLGCVVASLVIVGVSCRLLPSLSTPSSGGSSPAPSASSSSSSVPTDAWEPWPACDARVAREGVPRTRVAVRLKPRIVGGQASPAGKWPSAVALELPDGFQFCGGTLVRDRWVMTAGHCDVRVGELAVLGRVDLTTSVGQSIAIDEVRKPMLFVSAEGGWDVMLAHLSRASGVAVAPLVAPGWSGVGVPAEIVGWGLTSETAPATSPVLREAEVPIWSPATCSAAYPGVPETALCAGLAEGGKDTCQGDSGGGLYVQDGPRRLVAGITSYGDGCARPGRPGVYTAVAAVRAWVDACTQ